MDKLTIALVFLALAIIFTVAAIYLATTATPIPQIAIQSLALAMLFWCLFAIFVWWAITELKAELKLLKMAVNK